MRIETGGEEYRVASFKDGRIWAVSGDGKIRDFDCSQVKVTAFDEPFAEAAPDPHIDTLLPLLERMVEIQEAALERQPSVSDTLYVVVVDGAPMTNINGVSPTVWNRKAIAEVVAVQQGGVVMTTDEYIASSLDVLTDAVATRKGLRK